MDTHDTRVQGVRLSLAGNAEPDVAPYAVEPRQAVIKGGGHAKFTVRFCSERAALHAGYLHGVQKVFSPEVPLALKTWSVGGEGGEGVGVMLAGTFHPHAGQPPAPLQPLRVDLNATRCAQFCMGACVRAQECVSVCVCVHVPVRLGAAAAAAAQPCPKPGRSQPARQRL